MNNKKLDLNKNYHILNMDKKFQVDNMHKNILKRKNNYIIALKIDVQNYISNVLYPRMEKNICTKLFVDVEVPEKFRNDFCKQQILDILKNGDVYAEYINSYKLRIILCKSYTQFMNSRTDIDELDYLGITKMPKTDADKNYSSIVGGISLTISAVMFICLVAKETSDAGLLLALSILIFYVTLFLYVLFFDNLIN